MAIITAGVAYVRVRCYFSWFLDPSSESKNLTIKAMIPELGTELLSAFPGSVAPSGIQLPIQIPVLFEGQKHEDGVAASSQEIGREAAPAARQALLPHDLH